MGIKEGEWYEKYIHMYVFVREGVKKKIKDRDFSLSGGGSTPFPIFFLSFFEKFKQHF